MPLLILGPESYTNSQVASEGLVCVLWLIPIIAGAGVLVSARSLLTHANYREGAGLLIAGGIIGMVVLAGESFFRSSSPRRAASPPLRALSSASG